MRQLDIMEISDCLIFIKFPLQKGSPIWVNLFEMKVLLPSYIVFGWNLFKSTSIDHSCINSNTITRIRAAKSYSATLSVAFFANFYNSVSTNCNCSSIDYPCSIGITSWVKKTRTVLTINESVIVVIYIIITISPVGSF